jgi:hypothetical protein
MNENGNYVVDATVTGRSSVVSGTPDPAKSRRSFALEAPPAPPRGLRATVDTVARSVSLSWQPNTEPDMVGYIVYRALDSGSFEKIAAVDHVESGLVRYQDTGTAAAGGTYRYQVVAVRHDASDGGVSSEPAVARANMPDPPATTTTAPAPAGGSSSTSTTAPGGTSGTASGSTSPVRASSTAGAPAPGSELPRAGKVDLSAFGSLTAKAKVPPTPLPDGTFEETLDYSKVTTQPPLEEPEESALPIGRLVREGRDGRRPALVLVAGGLLVFMLAMHMRWLTRRAGPIDLA